MLTNIILFDTNAQNRELLNRLYNQESLTDKERAKAFSVICQISSLWLIVASALPAFVGTFSLAALANTGRIFTVLALPPAALLVSAFVLADCAFDIEYSGKRAASIAYQGGTEDEPTPFAINTIIKHASYRKVCAFLIEQVQVKN